MKFVLDFILIKRTLGFRALFVFQTIGLLYFSSIPASSVPSAGVSFDFLHFFAYLVFGIILSGSHFKRINVLGLGVGIGLVTEIIQYFVPYRTFDIMDFGINVLAILVAILIYKNYEKVRGR